MAERVCWSQVYQSKPLSTFRSAFAHFRCIRPNVIFWGTHKSHHLVTVILQNHAGTKGHETLYCEFNLR